ncbi:MAG: signal peptidase [Candidatus Binatota bacterium]|nr:signal peptidase [Candidatus Binatota bacterium]
MRWGASFLATALAVLVADQLTKAAIVATLPLHDSITILPGFFDIVHVRNPGAAFSVFAAAPEWFRGPFFVIVTVAAVIVLVMVAARLEPHDRFLRVALGAILGGALGNLVDRLAYGEVVDFVDVHWRDLHWPAFNVADSSITLAVAAVIAHSLFFADRASKAPGRSASP